MERTILSSIVHWVWQNKSQNGSKPLAVILGFHSDSSLHPLPALPFMQSVRMFKRFAWGGNQSVIQIIDLNQFNADNGSVQSSVFEIGLAL